jgi:SAM-dependent methyltransferase
MLKRLDTNWGVTKNHQLEKSNFVKKQIGEILLSFENEPKSRESLSRLVDDLLKIKYADSESSDVFDRSFSQEEINSLLLALADDFAFDNSKKDKEIIFKLFNNVFSAERKTAEENNTVSDLSAEGFLNLIRGGKVLNGAFVYGLEAWLQNLQMVNPKDRIKLISFFLNNPGQVSSALIPNLIGAQGIFGEALVSDLEQEFEGGKNQAEKMMAILDVLFVLEKMSGGPFDDAAKKAGEILEKIKTTCDNYFVQERISTHEITQEFFHKYDDKKLRALAPDPLEIQFYPNHVQKKRQIHGCSFSKICDKYGVIYNFFGEIDSFFPLDGEKKNLRVEEILEREGFANFKNLSQDEQDALVNNYLSLAHVYFREKIEKDFGFKLEDLSFREQIQFLNFISSRNTSEIEKIKRSLDYHENEAKLYAVRVFLSVESAVIDFDNEYRKEVDYFYKILEKIFEYEINFLSLLKNEFTKKYSKNKFSPKNPYDKKSAVKALTEIYKSTETNKIEEKLKIGTDFIISKTLIDLVNAVGLEEVQNILNEIENRSDKAEIRRLAQYSRSFITPIELGQESITNLQDFYQEKIEFQNYELNEKMNVKEVELLKNILDKNDKILEAGCGAGRLILELLKTGYDVSGFDFTPKHVKHVKKQNPEAQVAVGDWHEIDSPDASYDAVYSLGRNILHDYSLIDQMQTFKEVARILRPGGKFIFDIPNREQGVYRQMVEKYASEMESRGIRNFRHGAIYDSPDGKNFATRYTYSEDDIRQLAELAGFKIMEIKNEKLETGQGDENLYFILEKIKNQAA